MTKAVQGKGWGLVKGGDDRRNSKFPDGDVPLEPPAKIEGFQITTSSAESVSFSWNADEAADSYTLGRGLGDGFGSIIPDTFVEGVAVVNAPTTTITDTGPVGGFVEGQEYYWRVAGVNSAGQGGGANRIFVTPVEAAEPPPPPSDINPASVVWVQNFEEFSLGFKPVSSDYYGTTPGYMRRSSTSASEQEIVNDFYKEGTRSWRTYVPPRNVGGPYDAWRSEASLMGSPLRNALNWQGTVQWFGFAVRVHPDFPLTNKADTIILQFAHPSNWAPLNAPSNSVFNISIRSAANGLKWRATHNGVVDGQKTFMWANTWGYAPSNFGSWTRFVIRMMLHPTNGSITIWQDDTVVVDRPDAPTYPAYDECGYWKIGQYPSGFKYDSGLPSGSNMYIWYDSVRHALENLGGNYATVNPASYGSY